MRCRGECCLFLYLLGLMMANQGCQAPGPPSLEEQLVQLIPEAQRIQQPQSQISGDEKWMVFEATVGKNIEVFLRDLRTGQEANISNCSARDYRPSISSDAKKVVFWSDRAGHPELYDVNLADLFHAKGLKAEDEGRADSAISYFQWAIDVDILHIPSHHELGRAYGEQKNYERAIEEFSIVTELCTSELIESLARQVKTEKQLDSQRQSLKQQELGVLVNNAIAAFENLALAHIHKGDRKTAAGVHYALGFLFDRIQWNNFAIDEFRKGISVDPKPSGDVYNSLGKLYGEIEDYESAIDVFTEALRISPDSPAIHTNLGVVYVRLGSDERARLEFQKAIEIEPNYVEAHQNLAVYYFDKGEYRKALEEWQTLLEIAPEYPNVKKNIDLARKYLKKAGSR